MMPRSKRSGAMLLITVLLTSAIALVVSLSIALQGLQELSMGRAEPKSAEVLGIADGCMEEALLRLSRSSAYTGGLLTFGNGTCVITVTTTAACPVSPP